MTAQQNSALLGISFAKLNQAGIKGSKCRADRYAACVRDWGRMVRRLKAALPDFGRPILAAQTRRNLGCCRRKVEQRNCVFASIKQIARQGFACDVLGSAAEDFQPTAKAANQRIMVDKSRLVQTGISVRYAKERPGSDLRCHPEGD